MPRTNAQYWARKIDDNRARDLRKESQLKELGLRVLTVWECELRDKEALRAKLLEFLAPPC